MLFWVDVRHLSAYLCSRVQSNSSVTKSAPLSITTATGKCSNLCQWEEIKKKFPI
jgi:hypothetical protein